MRFVTLVLPLLLETLHSYETPAGYRLSDPNFDHDAVARRLADSGRLGEAIRSFRAACRFAPQAASSYINLGVALMRDGNYGHAHKALTVALQRDPKNKLVIENLHELHGVALARGIGRAALEQLSAAANLKITQGAIASSRRDANSGGKSKEANEQKRTRKSAGSSQKSDSGSAEGQHQSRTGPRGEHSKARFIQSPEDIARRGYELLVRGEKRLGRGFLSLALHINPWLDRDMPSWFGDSIRSETGWLYWQGNLFVGYDKTMLEHLASDDYFSMDEPGLYELAIYSWRNLQLTHKSCCGIDNLAVFLSMARRFGHGYIVPFLHLVPDYITGQLKQKNMQMYQSFHRWWQDNGMRPMPSPAITVENQRWEWSIMKVALPAARVPPGWDEMVQAALLFRLSFYEASRACLSRALAINSELASVADEILPGMAEIPVLQLASPQPTVKQKYLICYNPAVGLGNMAVVMVSAHVLAKLTGRTLVIHWNVNHVLRHAFHLREKPGVVHHVGDGLSLEAGVTHSNVKSIYLFHMMDTEMLGDSLELLGCKDPAVELAKHSFVTVSSNIYFAPLLATNPNIRGGDKLPDFPEALSELLEPSVKARRRALNFAKKANWGRIAPIVAIHIRSREEAQDNDDWPESDSVDATMLDNLVHCVQIAVARELGSSAEWDAFVAATTEKARSGVVQALKGSRGLRHVLVLPHIERSRTSGAGNTDAMAEALLISRADIFVRMVIGTTGFSTFAYLANALRVQTDWASDLPPFHGVGFAPNYLVTDLCGSSTCFVASPKVRMADVSWHGPRATRRSCGDVIDRLGAAYHELKCLSLEPVESGTNHPEEDEL